MTDSSPSINPRGSLRPTRRALLRGGSGAVASLTSAVTLAACQSNGLGASPGSAPAPADAILAQPRFVRFRGARQAGIAEAPPPAALFVALDLAPQSTIESGRRLMSLLTDEIERMMSGRGGLGEQSPELLAAPTDLTITLGLGRSFFDTLGLGDRAPSWLRPLPAYPTIDRLREEISGGDLMLQICASDPLVVSHVAHRLVRQTAGLTRLRWQQDGFRSATPAPGPGQATRNLFGQVDGTINPVTTGPDDALIWHGADAPDWLRGGSSMVLRRIAMDVTAWDGVDRIARENAVGRRLSDGAPLTATSPDQPADLAKTDALGFTVINRAAHIRRAAAQVPVERILRRPYNYRGTDAKHEPEVGLLFVAFQADPAAQFAPLQQRLAEEDLLNIWTTPVGSAVFAIPRGAQPGETLAETLLAP